ncbi:hypothetical protein QCA50_007701 [Cerrena zonata]|uniref:F-box domain-containing protein n=1 Tax=Cerrena zonata TaxID=2478898 RepID=A0AAW0G6B8_9APHY
MRSDTNWKIQREKVVSDVPRYFGYSLIGIWVNKVLLRFTHGLLPRLGLDFEGCDSFQWSTRSRFVRSFILSSSTLVAVPTQSDAMQQSHVNLQGISGSLLDRSATPNESEIQRRLDRLERGYIAARQELCFALNKSRKIYHLPLNILGMIFQLVLLPQAGGHADYKSLISVTQVCRTWRRFICDSSQTPIKQLWAYCWVELQQLHPQQLSLILQRAGDLPISVSLDLKDDRPDLVDWCTQNISHIQALNLQSPNLSDFAWLSKADSVRLEALYLTYRPQTPLHDENPLPQFHTTPKLRTLWMTGIRLPWERNRYLNITQLRITVPYQLLNGDKEFISIFQDSPHLEDLSISCKGEEELFVRSSEDRLPKVSRASRNPIVLRKLQKFHLSLCLADVQYILRQISTPRTTKVDIQVFIPPTVIKSKDRKVVFPDDKRGLLALVMVRSLVVDVEKRSIRGWVTRWGVEESELKEGIDLPLVNITIVPVKCNDSKDDNRAANVANSVFLNSVGYFFQNFLSPALFHLVLRDGGLRLEDGHHQVASLKHHIILPHLRHFYLLSHLRLENCSSDFVEEIYREGLHSTSWCLQTLTLVKMVLHAAPLRELSQNRTWLGDTISLYIPKCMLFADSQKDALETVQILSKIGSLTPQSTVSARWNQTVHLLEHSYSETDGLQQWRERQP